MTSTTTTPSMGSTAAQENLKRKSNDPGWEYAVCVNPKKLERVKCILCNKEMDGGINRLKQHIAQIKGNVSSCPKATKNDQIKCRDALLDNRNKKKGRSSDNETITIDDDLMEDSFGSMKAKRSFGPMDRFPNTINPQDVSNMGKSKQENMSNAIRKEHMVRVKEYICRWAYECAIPFHAFEKDSFKIMLEAVGQFGRGAPPPTRYEMGETYFKKEVERTINLLTPYKDEWKSNGCSIMTDAWSDRKRRSIMSLCVNSKMGTVFLSSKESSDEAHTSEHIHEYVESCIKEVGPENVVQIVTDNASNNMGAANGLPRYKKILNHAKTLTVFIYAHHKTLAMMRHFTKKRDIVQPGVTRFASAFLTLQSLADKKAQLKKILSNTVKGKATYDMVVNATFWAGVALCLKVFAPLVKVLRMVDADRKPSMGFVYGEIQNAKQEIINALGNNKKAYEPIMDIISKKMKGRLDTPLHLTAYLLNPYYLYKNPEIQNDIDVTDAIVDFVDTMYPGDHSLQNHIVMVELPVYMGKEENFSREIAIKGCEVNNDKFDPANWWVAYGASTPQLRKIATRILSLTTSSSGCERNWSTFEGVHTKKRNRLETSKLNNLVFVQFNENLMENNKKRKTKDMEVLLAKDASEAQEWIVENDVLLDEVEPDEAMGDEEFLQNRRSSRLRELDEEEFVSEDEEELNEDVEYE
uniref:BED-type domain-containing protein n=2 Tax=Lactuca sativa TaxID=4236 RepID=A0A9R1W0Q6_LACSA|nr:hypothetical protein LSAT_V11C400201400 [Lactuca sativa]